MTDAQKQSLDRRPTCKTCVFFDRELSDDTFGRCKKNAPKLATFKKMVKDDWANAGIWPVIHDWEWCGNHQDFGHWYRNDFDQPPARTADHEEIADE